MVTTAAFAAQAIERLQAAHIPDAAFEVWCLLEDIAGVPHGNLSEKPLEQRVLQQLDDALQQRLDGRPLQYILGEWDFLNLRLKVGEGVLIPRADTEILCETVAAALQNTPSPRILDLCAGSGCVGLGMASFIPSATVLAVEKFPKAWAFLQENIRRYPQYAVQAVQADVLTDFDAVDGLFDALVSNPPYIPTADLAGLMREVQKEPSSALDGGADGLQFYRVILSRWISKLKIGGFCAVEIGFDQAQAVNRLFGEAGLENCRIVKDYGGNDRVVIGRRKK